MPVLEAASAQAEHGTKSRQAGGERERQGQKRQGQETEEREQLKKKWAPQGERNGGEMQNVINASYTIYNQLSHGLIDQIRGVPPHRQGGGPRGLPLSAKPSARSPPTPLA